MTTREPLNAAEERLWRALAEIVLTLPRALEDEFMRETGLTLTEYSVLVSLSETLDHEQRLSELARSTGLSQSRISRLVGGCTSATWSAAVRAPTTDGVPSRS